MSEENSRQTAFLQAKKQLIEACFSGLNERQRQCVLSPEDAMLILAGAGSGKTTVLINRIACLIAFGRGYTADRTDYPDLDPADEAWVLSAAAGQTPVDFGRLSRVLGVGTVESWRILVITFTNKAAGELKERIARKLGTEDNQIWASTFHSACARILRSECEVLGYQRDFTIYDADDTRKLLKEVMAGLNIDEKDVSVRMTAEEISRAKDRLLTAADYAEEVASDARLTPCARIYAEYEKRLMLANAMDFDDLIFRTVSLFEQFPAVRKKYAGRFSAVLVDEFQDTNLAQYRLVRLLASVHGNVCVVGDDDQSIYGFRGAKVENILNFQQDFPGAALYRLEQNYRSTGNILSCANAVIANNKKRLGKQLWTACPAGSKVTVRSEADESREAAFICSVILKKQSEGGRWGDNAVLYRVNAQSNPIEQQLRYSGIPYRIVGGTRFFDRAEVKDCMSYLQVISNPSDYIRLSRIYNVPARGIGEKTFRTVTEVADASGISVFSAMRRAKEIEALSSRSANAAVKFTDMLMELIRLSGTLGLDVLYDEVLARTGYRDMLEKAAEKDPESRNRLENILELKSNIVNYMHTAEQPSLQGFLEETSLLTDIDRTDASADAVTLMTIHAAKGLEFERVFIAGCEEGLFPSSMSTDTAAGVEEERRLAYVAATRAKKELFFTYAGQRMMYGRTGFNPVSRFVQELPPECLQGNGAKQKKSVRYLEAQDFDFQFDRPAYSGRPAPVQSAKSPVSPKPSGKPVDSGSVPSDFREGDRVRHRFFGTGTLLSIRKMAGDSLVELVLDTGEVKRLMLSYGAKLMQKL